MSRKRWILATIIISLIHGLISFLLMPKASDIIWSRFDGNPYQTPFDPIWIGLYMLLNLPYYFLSDFMSPLKVIPGAFYLIWVGNSLTWGLLGAWLLSLLPFMKDKELPSETDHSKTDFNSGI